MTESFQAYDTFSAGADDPVLIVCDHATNALPREYAGLGLSQTELDRHIAWDPGAADMARLLARKFETTAILCGFSRLLIDANRGHMDPTQITAISDGTIIEGNREITPGEQHYRQETFHAQYHGAIHTEIERHLACGRVPVILSIHSFSPETHGKIKPWHLGVLWDQDDRLADPLLQHFEGVDDIHAGDNKPYSGAIPGDCMSRHGTDRGLPHVLIEFRQDLVSGTSSLETWSHHLYEALSSVLDRHGPFDIIRQK